MVDMSQPPQRSVPPPIQNQHNHFTKPTDFLFTALSIFFLFSPSSPSSSKTLKIPFLSFPINLNPRKFLKLPTMSSPPPPPLPISRPPRHFATPQSLSDWLKRRLPSDSFAMWGVKPGTKNVHNLWLELSEGETSLADTTPPLRTVNVVTVRIIGNDGKTLIESSQELSDGSVRDRFRPLSEKMKPDETPEDAVFRAIKEELGSIICKSIEDLREIVRIVPGSYQNKVEERSSASYPGLTACYVLHSWDAIVDGLPDEEFCTEEAEEYGEIGIGVANEAVSVKRHHWKWVSPDSSES